MSFRFFRLIVCAALILAAAAPMFASSSVTSDAAQTPPLQITFEAAAVSVRGNVGARFVVLSIVRRDRQLMYDFQRREQIVADHDRDGVVRLALPGPVPADSLWAIADLESGAYSIATPDGSPFVPLVESTPHRWKGDVDDELNRLEISREWVELLWISPGIGCWGLTNGDGGSFDKDGKSDGRISSDAEQMRRIGDSPAPPKRFKKKDLMIVIDPRGLRYFVLEVPK